jgi:hypothetical protein
MVYVDPTLVSVKVELDWATRPFDDLATSLIEATRLPAWKVPETSRNLRRIFDLAVADGHGFDVAWRSVDKHYMRILTNGPVSAP